MSADVRQVRKLSVDLKALGPKAAKNARVAIKKTCIDTKADGQAFAAVDTGFMRSSITYSTWLTKNAAIGEVGPTADYAPFVELGTSKMPPQPFMRPAFDRRAPLLELALASLKTGELEK